MDCTSSVSGPREPSIVDACCRQFQEGLCASQPIQSLPLMTEAECQRLCRSEADCFFYSSSPDACHLHSTCPSQRAACTACRSGPKRPPLDKVPNECEELATTTTTTSTTTTSTTTSSTSTTTRTSWCCCMIFFPSVKNLLY